MKIFLISLLCGIANRIRGGMRIFGKKLPLNKYWFAVVFACCYCYLTGWNLHKWSIVMIATRLGSQLYGWGEAIGCVLGTSKVQPERRDCELIDDILDNACIILHGKKTYLSEYPIFWGWCWLSLRGLIWTFLMGLAINSISYIFVGLTMGTCYYLCGLFSRKVKSLEKGGWNVAEIIFGIIMGLGLCLIEF